MQPSFELHMIEEGVAPISPERVLKYCKTVPQIRHLYTGGGPGSSSATSYLSEDFLRGQFLAECSVEDLQNQQSPYAVRHSCSHFWRGRPLLLSLKQGHAEGGVRRAGLPAPELVLAPSPLPEGRGRRLPSGAFFWTTAAKEGLSSTSAEAGGMSVSIGVGAEMAAQRAFLATRAA